MTTLSPADKSLSNDPSEVIPITRVPSVPDRSYQTPSEGNDSGSINGDHGDVFRVEAEADEVDSPGIVVDEPRLTPPMNKRKKFRLSDLNISKPKKKVASTFFGTVSLTFNDSL